MIYVSRRLIITCLLLITACVVAGIWGLRSGTVTLETSQIFAALMGDAPRSMTMVVTEWRLPRVLMALLIGAALGVSGAIFQSLMRNPLGSPDVMGYYAKPTAACCFSMKSPSWGWMSRPCC